MSSQDKPRLEELSGHTRVENRTIVWVYLVAFVVAVIIGLILRLAINATPWSVVRRWRGGQSNSSIASALGPKIQKWAP